MNSKVKKICINGIIAAAYCALSYLFLPISFGPIQVRIAESLCLLCFFRREYSIGITIGCILANLYSAFTLTPLDLLFGTLSTLMSCMLISICRHLLVAAFIPVIINGVVIGTELAMVLEEVVNTNVFKYMGLVALGELIALSIGYIVFVFLGKKEYFQELILANRGQNFKW